MDVLNALIAVFLSVVGAYLVIFNRRFTEEVYGDRFSDRWIPILRVFAVIVGAGMVVGVLVYAVQELLH